MVSMLYIATSFHRYLTLHTWIHKLFSLRYLYLFCLFCKEYLQNLRNDPVRSRICKQRVLCRTLAGNFVYILTVTNPSRRPADAEVCKITVCKITRHNVFLCKANNEKLLCVIKWWRVKLGNNFTSIPLFPNFTSIPFDYLLVSWVTN